MTCLNCEQELIEINGQYYCPECDIGYDDNMNNIEYFDYLDFLELENKEME